MQTAFLGNVYFRRIFRRRVVASSQLLSSASAAFLANGRCIAIMEGQPWAVSASASATSVSASASASSSLSSSSSAASKEIKSSHHKSNEHTCIGGKIRKKKNSLVFPSQKDTVIATMTQLKLSPEKNYSLRVKGHTTPKSGGAGIGLILEDSSSNETMWSARLYVSGDRTVFEAEYSAIILGIDYACNVLKARHLTVFSSNGVIVNHVRGIFAVTKSSLKFLLKTIKTIQQQLHSFDIEQIPLAENSEATAQALKALATRKSLNIEDKDWKVERNDPIQKLQRNPLKMGRWKKPDDPAQSTIIDPSRLYLLRFDGGARDCVGVGMVLYDECGKEIWCGWHFHPEAATNNVAEYMGLVCGLRCARSLGITKLIVEGDSLLVVRQMNGTYRTREGVLEFFREEARELIRDLSYCQIRYIARAENKRADSLATHAMDLKESDGFIRMTIDDEQ